MHAWACCAVPGMERVYGYGVLCLAWRGSMCMVCCVPGMGGSSGAPAGLPHFFKAAENSASPATPFLDTTTLQVQPDQAV